MFFKNEEEYKEYLEKNKIDTKLEGKENYFDITEEGEVLLENIKCKNSGIDVEKYTNCIGWVILNDKKTMALIKLPFGDVYRNLSLQQYETSIYNNILLPQIAKQLQNESAIYYIAKHQNKKGCPTDKRRYLLTLDFKNKNEKLIYGQEILEKMQYDINELRIEQLLFAVEDYLIEIGANHQDIENVKKDFIKQSFYNRLVKQSDENNHNWGILIDENTRKSRMTPLYDLDCSCDIGTLKKHIREDKEGGKVSFESFIKQFKNEKWFNIYLKEVESRFNIDKAIEDAKKETNITIPPQIQNIYKDFFGQRFYEFKNAYTKEIKQKGKSQQEVEK